MENKMTSNSNQITIFVYPSRKREKNMHKESVKQENKENQVIGQMGNRIYQPEEEKFDEAWGIERGGVEVKT
jgi:hypothetical protein